MTNAQELARVVQAEMRSILSLEYRGINGEVVRHPIMPHHAKAMLRIECSADALMRIIETDVRSGFFDSDPKEGRFLRPRKFIGVTLYPIEYDLPAPGWRVVNPMKAR